VGEFTPIAVIERERNFGVNMTDSVNFRVQIDTNCINRHENPNIDISNTKEESKENMQHQDRF
jgi:hypothetical protein